MKKALKIILIILLIIGISLATFVYLLPMENPVTMGESFINVPQYLTGQDMQIKVISFNIRCLSKEEDQANYWTNRKSDVLAFLEGQDADLIGFQELTHPQYKFLIDNLGDDYGYVGIYRTGLNINIGNLIMPNEDPEPNLINITKKSLIGEATAIFYRKARFELLEYDNFWLNENPATPSKGWDAGSKRICTVVKLKDHYTQKEFHCFNSHFDNKGTKAQVESAKIVISKINALQGGVILTGDFNFIENTQAYSIITSGRLSDARYTCPPENSTDSFTSNGYVTNAISEHHKIIDYVMLTETLFTPLSFEVVKDTHSGATFISDHYPIIAVLEYKEN